MSDFDLIGRDYTPPDLVAKITGAAKYSEDFRAEGMLFCRLLSSPLPHARVRHIDTSEAQAIPGVRAILTAEELPPIPRQAQAPPPPRTAGGGGVPARVDDHGQPIEDPATRGGRLSPMAPEAALTMEPLYEGEPILAVAAVDEATAIAAIERIAIEFERLPFVVDPLESLRPGGPNARLEGNVSQPGGITEIKWTEDVFTEIDEGRVPMGQVPDAETWSYGDLEAGFADAALVLDESLLVTTSGHAALEPRSSMAYWQNGKLYLHCGTQSLSRSVPTIAEWVGISPDRLELISEYTGGAFGGKNPSSHHVVIPATLARKTGQPVMLRITRDEEQCIGRTRPGMLGRAKVGFAADGRITALDLFLISDAGPYGRGDHQSGARVISAMYQPKAMRFRGIGVLTNTVPRGAQRGPGTQAGPVVEQVLTKAARQLGIDDVAIHRVNAPRGQAPFGAPEPDGSRQSVTAAHAAEALDTGADLFGWAERKRRSGRRDGSRVRGVGVALGAYNAGSIGFDGLLTLEPDGRLHIRSGCGHLGNNSVFDTTRAAAEALRMPWEKVEIVQGDSSKHLPWACSQGGSQTAHAMTRANWAAGLDAKRKLQRIAASDLGGRPDDYELGGERVFDRDTPSRGLRYADAARRAIELGGEYDGHDLPENLDTMTAASARALAGRGLMGVATDTFGRDGNTMTFVAGFAEVELDVETGEVKVLDYTAVADCGVVLQPRNCAGQVFGASMLGLSHALYHGQAYDRRYGLSIAGRFHHHKPPGILDAPRFRFAALGIPDPQTPLGVRGIGEPPVGAAFGAVMNALAAAVQGIPLRRTPVTTDVLLTALETEGAWRPELLLSHI